MAARALRRLLKSVRMSAALATPDSLATRGIAIVCGPSMEAVTQVTRTSPESERLDDLTELQNSFNGFSTPRPQFGQRPAGYSGGPFFLPESEPPAVGRLISDPQPDQRLDVRERGG